MQRKSMSFNGVRKPWLILRKGRVKSPFAPIVNNLLTLPGRHGAYIESSRADVLYISQPFAFIINNDAHALEIMDELASWLITDEAAELEFDDEPGRTYYAKIDGGIDDFERFISLREGTITFVCADPFSYGPEQEVSLSDIDSVEIEGATDAQPVFELTATKKSTFAMVSTADDKYSLLGHPVDVDEVVVDAKTPLLEERGQTLDTWTSAGTSVDGGVVAGSLSTDNDGITVPSYGPDTNNWHGPALIKEVTPAQDFEVEMMVQGRKTDLKQTFRIEVYLFDENMNNLGKMAIMDNNTNNKNKKAEGRIGAHVGRQVNYLISSKNYNYNQEYFYGMLRIKREGQAINFYVSRINNNNKHVQSLSETYMDNEDAYQGKLKFIQIHIGKYGATERAYAPKIDHIKVSELTVVTEDQTPYIIDVGDVVTFDSKNEEMLINGENAMPLKIFGSTFLGLPKGTNDLVISPEDSFTSKVKYRPGYK